jgi:hypothetical protein
MNTGTYRHWFDRRRDDAGSAMVLTLMVMALVTGLATTVAVVTISNLQSSLRAQQAGSALNAADAGVAQGMAYLRNSGVRDLTCSPATPATSNCTRPWGRDQPASVLVPGVIGQSYRVWIERVTPYTPSSPGLYRIHSLGAVSGAASRAVTADVGVTTTNVPKGIFARTISGGGNASVARESIFATGCVYDRSKITMSGMDLAYGIPVAVHSSQIITESNGTGQYCPTTKKPIHDPSATGNDRYCKGLYPHDQDRLGGGSLSGTSCESAKTQYPTYYGARDLDEDGTIDVDGSLIKDDAALYDLFGIRSPALSPAQVDQMRIIAQSQGNFHTSATGWASPDESNAVMFFDLAQAPTNSRTVDLNDITGFSRSADVADTDIACESRSLIIIIEGGNAKLNSKQRLFASLFLTSPAPYGQVLKANGTSDFIGTIYADNVNLVGTANLSMDGCFLANISPALLDLSLSNYREEDRGLS